MIEPSAFAVALAVARFDRDISQAKLADLVDCDHSYISRLENGDRWPSRDMASRLADALALTPLERDGLMIAAGFMPDDPTAAVASVPELRELFQLIESSELRQSIIRPMLAHLVALARSAA